MVDKDGFLGSALAAYSDAKVAIDDATGAIKRNLGLR